MAARQTRADRSHYGNNEHIREAGGHIDGTVMEVTSEMVSWQRRQADGSYRWVKTEKDVLWLDHPRLGWVIEPLRFDDLTCVVGNDAQRLVGLRVRVYLTPWVVEATGEFARYRKGDRAGELKYRRAFKVLDRIEPMQSAPVVPDEFDDEPEFDDDDE